MPVKKRSYKRKQSNVRKPFWESVTEWSLRLGKRFVPIALAIWLIGWLWLGGVFGQAQQWAWHGFVSFTAGQGLVVEDVVISGRDKTDLNALQQVVQINKGDPALSIDIDGIQSRIQSLPWVKSSTVRRTYNGMIYVDLVERIPFVLWKRPGRSLAVVDTDGDVISQANPNNFKSFLYVSGVAAPKHIVPLMQDLMAQPDLKNYIKGAEWIGDRRWDLFTIHGTRVHLPEDDVGFSLARLIKIHHEKLILDQALVSIDLRGDDRIIIETERGKAQDVMHMSSRQKTNAI